MGFFMVLLFIGGFCYSWVTWGLVAAIVIMFGGVALVAGLFSR